MCVNWIEGSSYLANIAEIENSFAADSVESIIYSLLQSGTQFGESTAVELMEKSPASLEVRVEKFNYILRVGNANVFGRLPSNC
jgi:hypothetical protein